MGWGKRPVNPVFDVYQWRRSMGGITQAKASELLCISPREITRYEREGVAPRPYTIRKMVNLLEQKKGGVPVGTMGKKDERRLKIDGRKRHQIPTLTPGSGEVGSIGIMPVCPL